MYPKQWLRNVSVTNIDRLEMDCSTHSMFRTDAFSRILPTSPLVQHNTPSCFYNSVH